MKILNTVIILLLTCYACYAPTIKFGWCPSTDPYTSGYNVYFVVTNKVPGWKGEVYTTNQPCAPILTNGTNWIRNYGNSFSIPLTNNLVFSNAIIGKTYYFSITSRDTNNQESPFANELEITVTNPPPSIPKNFQVLEIRQ